MPDGNLETIIDKLGRDWEEFKSTTNREIAEIKKTGAPDPLTTQKLEKLSKSMDDLEEAKSKLEADMKTRFDELEKKANRPQMGTPEAIAAEAKALEQFNMEVKAEATARNRPTPADIDADGAKAYKSALNTYLRKGRDGLTQDEFKALSVGGDPQGGYLVMPDTSGRIITRLNEYSPMRQLATVETIGTGSLKGPVDRDEADAGWTGEKTARPETDAPEVGEWEIVAEEMYAKPKASQTLIDDSTRDISGWLGGKVSDKFARVEHAGFTTGNGIKKPRGFATYSTVVTDDDSRSWGVMQHVATGVNGGFAGSNPADHLFDLIGKFNAGYLQNAAWQGRRAVKTAIRKFKGSDNNYLWQPGLEAGQPQRLLEYPWYDNEYMAALSANGLSLALGDFREGYTIVDRMGIRVLVDPYTDKPWVVFYSTKRTGGGVLNFDAIKFIKFATS